MLLALQTVEVDGWIVGPLSRDLGFIFRPLNLGNVNHVEYGLRIERVDRRYGTRFAYHPRLIAF
jgi:hypothetical protein